MLQLREAFNAHICLVIRMYSQGARARPLNVLRGPQLVYGWLTFALSHVCPVLSEREPSAVQGSLLTVLQYEELSKAACAVKRPFERTCPVAPIMYGSSPLSCTQAELPLFGAHALFPTLMHCQTWLVDSHLLRLKEPGRDDAPSLRRKVY